MAISLFAIRFRASMVCLCTQVVSQTFALKTSPQGLPVVSAAPIPVISFAALLKRVIMQLRSTVKTPSAILLTMTCICGDKSGWLGSVSTGYSLSDQLLPLFDGLFLKPVQHLFQNGQNVLTNVARDGDKHHIISHVTSSREEIGFHSGYAGL